MQRQLRWLFISIIALLVGMAWQGMTGYAWRGSGEPEVMEPLWTTGQVTSLPGEAGVIVTDLEADGSNEIVSCTETAPFVLKANDTEFYYSAWYGERLDCSALAVADADDDTVQEIYVGSNEPFVYVYTYNGRTYIRTATIDLPGSEGVNGVALGDVDADSDLEIVVTRTDRTLVYDATTYALEWDAIGFGGSGVAIANIKAPTGKLLIIVNGIDGYYLDAVTETLDGSYAPGFGDRMAVGNLDGDDFAEIAWHNGSTVNVLDADTATVKWTLNNGSTQWITVANVDGSPEAEVVTGSASLGGTIRARNGNNGTEALAFNNQYWGVYGLGVGDANDDGVLEIAWGTEDDSGVGYAFVVTSLDSTNNQFIHPVWDAPWHTAAGDIDNDGTVEIVVVPRSSGVDYYGATIAVFDSTTYELEWNALSDAIDVWDVEVAQLDDDAALEIALAGRSNSGSTARVVAYDGITRAVEWQNGFAMGTGPATALTSANLDGDARAELAVGTAGGRLYVLNGRTDTIQYQNTSLGGAVEDVEIGNADSDVALEVAVVTPATLYLFQSDTWTQSSSTPSGTTAFRAVAFGNEDSAGDGELLLVGENTVEGELRFLLLEGDDLSIRQDSIFGNGVVQDILVTDADGDEKQEYIVAGQTEGSPGTEAASLLQVYEYSLLTSTLEYDNTELWGNINTLALTNIGDSEDAELLLSTNSLVQLRQLQAFVPITPTPSPTISTTPTQTPTPTITPTPIPDAPDIFVAPTSVAEIHLSAPQVTTQTLTLGNQGVPDLVWTLVEDDGFGEGGTCDTPTDISWLSVSPTNGTVPGSSTIPLTLTFDSASLAVGIYEGTLCINSNDPDEQQVLVPVALTVGLPTAVTLSEWRSMSDSYETPFIVTFGLLLLGAGWWVARRR